MHWALPSLGAKLEVSGRRFFATMIRGTACTWVGGYRKINIVPASMDSIVKRERQSGKKKAAPTEKDEQPSVSFLLPALSSIPCCSQGA